MLSTIGRSPTMTQKKVNGRKKEGRKRKSERAEEQETTEREATTQTVNHHLESPWKHICGCGWACFQRST